MNAVAPGFDRLQFSRVHFEIGMKADEVCETIHASNQSLPQL